MFTLIGIIALVVYSIIQGWLRNIYLKWMPVANSAGLTDGQKARIIPDANGLTQVQVEATRGVLSNPYDPRSKLVRLSFGYASITSMAALEVGKASKQVLNAVAMTYVAAATSVAYFFTTLPLYLENTEVNYATTQQ